MRPTTYTTRIRRILALAIAACLAFAGFSAPAIADDAPQTGTGTVIAPIGLPAGTTIADVNEYMLTASLHMRVDEDGEKFRDDVPDYYYEDEVYFDPSVPAFVFPNVPLTDNLVVRFSGDWTSSRYAGGDNLDTAQALNLATSGETKTFSTFAIAPQQRGTVLVPLTLPATLDPARIAATEGRALSGRLYTREVIEGTLQRVSLSDYDPDPTFDAAIPGLIFRNVPLTNGLIARVNGQWVESSYAGNQTLANTIAMDLTNAGSTITFPTTTVVKRKLGTVHAPFTLPASLNISELSSSELDARLITVSWDASLGQYVEDDDDSAYGILDEANSRFVFEDVEMTNNMAVVFEGDAIDTAFAGGADVSTATRLSLTNDGQIITFPHTALSKQAYGTVRVPVVLPTGVTVSDFDNYRIYASLYKRVWHEDDAFQGGGYYTSEYVDYDSGDFDHSKNEFVFTGVGKHNDIYADFGGSKSPDWYTGGRSMATAQTVSITHDGQDVSFDRTDLSQVNRAAAKIVLFDASFPEHHALAYVRWELFDQNGKIVPAEFATHTGSWETAEWQFKISLDPSISGTYTVGLSTEHTGTFFPTATGGKTRDISKAQFLTLNDSGATQFNAVNIVYPEDYAHDLLAIKGVPAPSQTVSLDYSAYPWKRIYGDKWYTRSIITWEVADTAAGPWTEIGFGPSVKIPTDIQQTTLRATVNGISEIRTVSVLVSIKGLALKAVSKPTISGTPAVKSTLKAKDPRWSSRPDKVSYQWLANGAAIKGATSPTYGVPESALGKAISVKVTASKAGFVSVSSVSTPTAKIAAGAMTATKPVTITGTSRVASTLTAKAASWSQGGTSVKYQWNVNGVAVKGATKTTFTVPSSAAGKTITVTATATKTGYATAKSTSSKTKTVAKSTATVSGKLAKTSIKKKKSTTITVTVKTPGITRPTGTVTVKVGSKSVKAKIKSSHKGKIKITLKGSKLKTGKKQKVTVAFTPSGSTAKAVNKSKTTKISKTLTVAK